MSIEQYLTIRFVLCVLLLGLLVSGCSSSSFDEDGAIPTTIDASQQETTTDAEDDVTTSPITITGVVGRVAASARVIDLRQPVAGFDAVALIKTSKVMRADGSEEGLQALRPGQMIQVSGRPGSSGTLLADEIRILSP